MTEIARQSEPSRWPHRLAVALVVCTFPVIWVGGLVTTLKAGMAVWDWPTTFGYNMFLYPLGDWLAGPTDIFIEHGHRLLASTAGLLTIAVTVAVLAADRRRWLKWLAVATLLAVIGQGVLGGMRVLLDEVQLAKIHGCVGPLFFGMTVALAVFTSRRWTSDAPPESHGGAARLHRLAAVTTLLTFIQIVLGAQIRHLPIGMDPYTFRALVIFHLLMAAVLTVHVVLLAIAATRIGRQSALIRPAMLLVLLIAAQLGLGAASWVSKYGWPVWFEDSSLAAGHLIVSGGAWQAGIVTGHVALGSLMLAVSLMMALRSLRLLQPIAAPGSALALLSVPTLGRMQVTA